MKSGDGKLDLSGLRVKLDVAAETRQMWDDGWRIVRDWFYDEKMHGVDWAGLKNRYGALVPYVAHRADLDFLFGEIMGELESGHTYVASGDEPKVPRVIGGMLGCEFAADASGRYRIAKVFPGENWDDAWRSPLTEPGVDVKEGSFLLAIDGRTFRRTTTRTASSRGRETGRSRSSVGPVRRRRARAPSRCGRSRREPNLRYLDWVKTRMAMVDKLSGGKVGYIHLPTPRGRETGCSRSCSIRRLSRPALLVDDRYNGGGFIPDRMIEYFSRQHARLLGAPRPRERAAPRASRTTGRRRCS